MKPAEAPEETAPQLDRTTRLTLWALVMLEALGWTVFVVWKVSLLRKGG
jgi:hypothetical protein